MNGSKNQGLYFCSSYIFFLPMILFHFYNLKNVLSEKPCLGINILTSIVPSLTTLRGMLSVCQTIKSLCCMPFYFYKALLLTFCQYLRSLPPVNMKMLFRNFALFSKSRVFKKYRWTVQSVNSSLILRICLSFILKKSVVKRGIILFKILPHTASQIKLFKNVCIGKHWNWTKIFYRP